MKTVVRYLDNSTEEFETDGVAINPAGLLVLVKSEQAIATLVPQNIVGIFHPEGPSKVKLAQPGLVQL